MHSLESDPTLSYIASCLASRVSQQAEAAPLRAAAGGSSNLRPEVQLWEVLWQDVTIEHPIGQGSFGNVYLGRWQQTPVAVKVLINRGECRACQEEDGLVSAASFATDSCSGALLCR